MLLFERFIKLLNSTRIFGYNTVTLARCSHNIATLIPYKKLMWPYMEKIIITFLLLIKVINFIKSHGKLIFYSKKIYQCVTQYYPLRCKVVLWFFTRQFLIGPLKQKVINNNKRLKICCCSQTLSKISYKSYNSNEKSMFFEKINQS